MSCTARWLERAADVQRSRVPAILVEVRVNRREVLVEQEVVVRPHVRGEAADVSPQTDTHRHVAHRVITEATEPRPRSPEVVVAEADATQQIRLQRGSS